MGKYLKELSPFLQADCKDRLIWFTNKYFYKKEVNFMEKHMKIISELLHHNDFQGIFLSPQLFFKMTDNLK